MPDSVPPAAPGRLDDALPPPSGRRLALYVGAYAGARALLVAALWGTITGIGAVARIETTPVLVLLISIGLALPISQIVFRRMRTRIRDNVAAIDIARQQRSAEPTARA